MNWKCFLCVGMTMATGALSFAAEIPKAPVPVSRFIRVVYGYADTMLKNGRDTYGPQKTGLFLGALDRATLGPVTNRPNAPKGVSEEKRVGAKGALLTGANPQHDENFLRLLYTLSELSGKAYYREAADAELRWFLDNARSTNTHLLPWGDYMSWDVINDQSVDGTGGQGIHRFFRPWMLWDRCFALAPESSKKFALGLWGHQIANHEDGNFNASAVFSKHGTSAGLDLPNHAGFYIRTWAAAFANTGDEQFLRATDVLLTRFEKKRHPITGLIETFSNYTNARMDSVLSLAIDCDGAAQHVPEPLASRLREFAAREDEIFCALPHDVKRTGGLIISLSQPTGKVAGSPTWRWNAGYGITTAQLAMMCVSRYDNTGKIGYRNLILSSADAYLNSLPPDTEDAWPLTFGQAISLELAAWRHSADWKYMERARQLGDIAVEKFWGTNALPRASLKTDHYEAITGADTLALALLELHLQILHITAVRCPPNTIDR
jgi:hypothetical protein